MAILPEKRPVVPWQLARPLAALSTERVRAVIVPAYLTTNFRADLPLPLRSEQRPTEVAVSTMPTRLQLISTARQIRG